MSTIGVTLTLVTTSIPGADDLAVIEIFVSGETPDAVNVGKRWPSVSMAVYPIDALDQLQCILSLDLPADPEVAKRLAQSRIEGLDTDRMAGFGC